MPILKILNPRQGQRAQQLSELINNEGWQALAVPSFVIDPGCDESRFIKEFPSLVEANKDLSQLCFIFISTNAVLHFYKLCQTHLSAFLLQTLAKIPCFAVGKATQKQLLSAGFEDVVLPEQESAVGILQHPKIEQFSQVHNLMQAGMQLNHFKSRMSSSSSYTV